MTLPPRPSALGEELPRLCSNAIGCELPATKLCTRCRAASYCSVACQSAHYAHHRPACLATAAACRGEPAPVGDVCRLVTLPDEAYDAALAELSRGRSYSVVGRSEVATSLKLRSDGRLCQLPSGLRVVRLSAVRSAAGEDGTAATTVQALSVWGRLALECGDHVGSGEGHAMFRSPDGWAHVVDKAADRLVASFRCGGRAVSARFFRAEDGRLGWVALVEVAPGQPLQELRGAAPAA